MNPLVNEIDDSLTFVNISRPNDIKLRDTQRTIRRRVMRDIGRSRRSHKRRWWPTWELSLDLKYPHMVEYGSYKQPLPFLDAESALSTARITSPTIPRSLDPSNSAYYPVKLDSRALQLIHFMHGDADYVYRPFRRIWLTMSLTDPAAFHLTLANAAMFLDQHTHTSDFKYEKSTECLTYYGKCVRQITERLGSIDDSVSEGVITTVLGLLCHDLYVGTWDRWAFHIAGLQRIVALRGGYAGLDQNIPLFILWFDVTGSVVYDSYPRFPISVGEYAESWKSRSFHPHVVFPSLRSFIEDLTLKFPCFAGVAVALEKVALIAEFVNDHANQPSEFLSEESNLKGVRLIGPATHFLLSMPRPPIPSTPWYTPSSSNQCKATESIYKFDRPSSTDLLQEAVRLSLLVFIAAVKRTFLRLSFYEMDMLRDRFSNMVHQMRGVSESSVSFLKLQLWALVTVSLSRHTEPGLGSLGQWYVDDIRWAMAGLGIASGSEAINIARELIWVEALWKESEAIERLVSEVDIAMSDI